jgi:hypothetical protein
VTVALNHADKTIGSDSGRAVAKLFYRLGRYLDLVSLIEQEEEIILRAMPVGESRRCH